MSDEVSSMLVLGKVARSSRGTFMGLAISGLLLVAGSIASVAGWTFFSDVLWGLSFASFAASALYAFFGKPIQAFQGYFDHTVGAFLKRDVDQGYARYLLERSPLDLVWRLCRPFVDKALSAQAARPITSRLQLRFTVERLEENTLGNGSQLMLVTLDHDWWALTGVKVHDLRELVPPVFVCEDSALNWPGITWLEDEGFIDLLWPIPAPWLGNNPHAGDLRARSDDRRWYSVTGLTIQEQPMAKSLASSSNPQEIRGAIEDACKRALKRLDGQERRDNERRLTDDVLEAFVKQCVLVSHVKADLKPTDVTIVATPAEKGFQIRIEVQSSYWVWVKGAREMEHLYRYDIPFDRPAFVGSIQFGLAALAPEGLEPMVNKWHLIPPTVRCGFDLEKPAERSRHDTQLLRWKVPDGAEAFGTPFLPGHGVTFMWTDPKAETRSTSGVGTSNSPATARH
jgi:hypothetical protein